MSQMLPEIFEGLARDAAQAMEDSAEADAGFFEKTAGNEDTALANIAGNEQHLAGQAQAISGQAGQDATAAAGLPGFSGRTSDDDLTNALRDWQSERFQFGNQQFLLDKGDFGHILSRHMPDLWDGSVKRLQTFFPPGMSAKDIQDAIGSVLRQNRDTLIGNGTNDIYQIEGIYDGREYVLGINHGHIAQFYPKPGR
jgi:Bacterial EndoU nuclease